MENPNVFEYFEPHLYLIKLFQICRGSFIMCIVSLKSVYRNSGVIEYWPHQIIS